MSLYWYDFETTGAVPSKDRPVQFAGIRTDENFKIIDDPLEIFCRPSADVIPQPEACLVTGITPQQALEKGIPETEFMQRILVEFSKPDTCVLGYNSLRFDDEVTRYSLYRNLFDPYSREWKNGNSRWDLIDVVRAARLLRPEGIEWPNHPDGKPSFRLEDITAANGIEQQGAHDALVDVRATIAVAALLREKQPKLFNYFFDNRSKEAAGKLLNLKSQEAVLHVSSKFPADKGCGALVMPLAADPKNPKLIYVVDLAQDPTALINLSAEEIRERVFTRQADLPEGVERVALKGVYLNKCPVLAPPKVLSQAATETMQIDLALCEQHRQQILAASGLNKKIIAAFSSSGFEAQTDPDLMLYGGDFFSRNDRQIMDDIHQLTPDQLASKSCNFEDERLAEMFFRFRARNYPETLTEAEQERWLGFCRHRVSKADGGGSIYLSQFFERVEQLREERTSERDLTVLYEVESYVQELADALGLDPFD